LAQKENAVRALDEQQHEGVRKGTALSDYFDAIQLRTQTESQEAEDGDITAGWTSQQGWTAGRTDIFLKGADALICANKRRI
jgi:hypothetical protein